MFDMLELHYNCETPTFYELLIGYSPLNHMPPSHDITGDILPSPKLPLLDASNATSEMLYGAGADAEIVGVR